MPSLQRILAGAAGGAAVGLYNTGSLSGMMGGAGAGALMGGYASRLTGNRGVAHLARKATGYGMRAARAGARMGARGYYGAGGAAGYLGGGSLFRASAAAGRGLTAANRFIGSNVSAINKYGGYAAGAIGVASAGYIGSSVLSSNKGR